MSPWGRMVPAMPPAKKTPRTVKLIGSIEQRGDSYRLVWRHGGKKQSVTLPGLEHIEKAQRHLTAHLGKLTADQVYDHVLPKTEADTFNGPTLREWCDQWLDAKTRITPGTRSRYQSQLQIGIYPFQVDTGRDGMPSLFGDTPIEQITGLNIGRWINWQRTRTVGGKPVTNATVTRYFSVLFGALAAAERQGLIPLNPCKLTDFVRDQIAEDGEEHQPVYLTPDEFELLKAQFEKRWWPFLEFLAGTGARWSESTAVAVEHILAPAGKKKPKVRIWRAWKRGGKGEKPYLGPTKGRTKREVPVSRDLYDMLTPLIEGRPASALLFCGVDGKSIEQTNWLHRVWQPAVRAARQCAIHPPPPREEHVEGARGRCKDFGGTRKDGRPCGAKVRPGTTRCPDHSGPDPDAPATCDCSGVLRLEPTPHDLRHSHAAWLFSDPRMTPLAISRRLGHKTLAVTSDIYGDLMPEAADAAVDALDDLRGGKKDVEEC